MPADKGLPRDPPAEDLLAAMGIEPILEPRGRIRITAEIRHRATRLRPNIQVELRRFLARSELEGERPLADFNYRKALDILTELDAEQRITELAGAVEDQEAAGVITVAGRALQYLRGIVPARSRVTITGPRSVPPSDLQRYKFRRAYSVIEDPMEPFRDMNEGNLSRDQVRTLQTVYPSIYDFAEKTLFEEMADLKGKRPNLEFSRDKTRQIENLWLTRSWTPDLARKMQEAFSQKEPQQPPKRSLTNSSADASETPIQRAESK